MAVPRAWQAQQVSVEVKGREGASGALFEPFEFPFLDLLGSWSLACRPVASALLERARRSKRHLHRVTRVASREPVMLRPDVWWPPVPPRVRGGSPSEAAVALERLRIGGILEEAYRRHGVDLRGYSYPAVRRRLWRLVRRERLSGLEGLSEWLAARPAARERLRTAVSVTVTAMFRDAPFFRAFRERVVPHLRMLSSLRVWHAGCATGEEVYSMAILLEEEGLLDRARVLGTDVNREALERAAEATLPAGKLDRHAEDHRAAGGRRPLSHYLRSTPLGPSLCPALLGGVTFAVHDLTSEPPLSGADVMKVATSKPPAVCRRRPPHSTPASRARHSDPARRRRGPSGRGSTAS